MASDALFMALAQAKAQPDRWARSVNAAGQAGEDILGGYLKGAQIRAGQQEAALKPYEIWSKISDSAGPDVANSIFKQKGIPVPDMSGSDSLDHSAMRTQYTPDQLTNMGTFGQKRLTARQTAQNIEQTSPVDFGQVDSFFSSAGKPEIGKALIDAATKSGRRNVQKDIFDKATSLVGPKSDIADSLNRRTDLQVANAINHNVNAMTGTGALGQSGKNNLRLARIQPLLTKDGPLTPQELERINTDIDGVITGGVPLRSTEEGQKIATFATEIARLKQQFGNNPEAFNDAGFRQRIVPLVNGLIAADNEVQDRAFSMVKANYGHLTTPEHLARVEQAIRTGQQLPIIDVIGGGVPGGEIPGGGTGDPEADAAIFKILSSNEPTAKKQAGITAIRARAGQQ